MQLLGYLLILLAAFGIWSIQSLSLVMKFWGGYLVAVAILCIGIYLTQMPPYFAIAGFAISLISQIRLVTAKWSKFLLSIGIGLVIASVTALFVSQFQSPGDGEREEEDRTEWDIEPRPVFTDGEKLNQLWSAYDEYADWPVAELMVELCQIAYQPPVEAREILRQRGFESETIESGSMSGYVIKSGENAVILLRGTESSWHDVLQDLIFISSHRGNGRMHAGFRSGYSDSMHRQVQQLLQRFGTKRVWITGHSLGGALAVVCAHDLLVDGEYEIAGVMTFGQPKVVRTQMRDFLEPRLADRYVVFVNDMDPVPKVVEPYLHFGHMVWYRDGKIERSQRIPVTTSTSNDSVPGQPTEIIDHPDLDSFSDEELQDYIQRLQEAENPPKTGDGPQVYQGVLPDVADHYLDSYGTMIKFLVHGEPDRSQP